MTSAALISLQDRPKRSPFRIHPAADQNDGGDDGNQHDPEKDGVFDESSALLILPEPVHQLQSLTHYILSSWFRILCLAVLARWSRTARLIACLERGTSRESRP